MALPEIVQYTRELSDVEFEREVTEHDDAELLRHEELQAWFEERRIFIVYGRRGAFYLVRQLPGRIRGIYE